MSENKMFQFQSQSLLVEQPNISLPLMSKRMNSVEKYVESYRSKSRV
jgi:hypothetical protein